MFRKTNAAAIWRVPGAAWFLNDFSYKPARCQNLNHSGHPIWCRDHYSLGTAVVPFWGTVRKFLGGPAPENMGHAGCLQSCYEKCDFCHRATISGVAPNGWRHLYRARRAGIFSHF